MATPESPSRIDGAPGTSPRRGRRVARVALEALLLAAVAVGAAAGTLLLTVRGGDAATHFLLSLDGPAVVAQQSPYQPGQALSAEGLEQKYHIYLLAPGQVDGRPRSAGFARDWSQDELRKLDIDLSNTPAQMYGTAGGARLTLSIGSLDGIGGDIAGGVCKQDCGGFYDAPFYFGGGLVGFNQGYFDLNTAAFDQTLVDHELAHREHQIIAAGFDPAVRSVLGDIPYLSLPEFSGTDLPPGICSAKAILALRSLSGAPSDDPHIDFEEGVAETSEMYIGGYRTFMAAYGPELNGRGCGSYALPPDAELLAAEFPQADALYRLWQDQVFWGFGYDETGMLVPGPAAIPGQLDPATWTP